MPTYKHDWSVSSAIVSLLGQEFTDWELVIVDDGSPDSTFDVVTPHLDDPRVRYHRQVRNCGLGAALNVATQLARGRYIAYLPSDDIYYPDHLSVLVERLERSPELHLCYSGVSVHHFWTGWSGLTLQGDVAVGRELDFLAASSADADPDAPRPASGNLLALVQVMHRRTLDGQVPWPTREEIVSDALERDHWRALLERGATFACTGTVTCEWRQHPDQRHKIISQVWGRQPGAPGGRAGRGLSGYRAYYGLGAGDFVNWQPVDGIRVNERDWYGPLADRQREGDAPEPTGDALKILLVGELSHNPERVLALEEAGHRLYGMWIPYPEAWDAACALPVGGIRTIPYDRHWRDRVREIQPDLVYALLNYQAIELTREVVTADLGAPVAFHFKESPFFAQRFGLWPALLDVLSRADGHVFISEENHAWFQWMAPEAVRDKPVLLLDGDMPKADWFRGPQSPKLSSADGQIHTVCAGRPVGLDDFAELASRGINVHFYGEHFHGYYADWVARHLPTGHLHLHPAVGPKDWAAELSAYDAAWTHLPVPAPPSKYATTWRDLNLPARLGTYAAAGLPLIVGSGNWPSAVGKLARHHGVGIFFDGYDELAAQLRDGSHLTAVTENMRARKLDFSFDRHVPELVDFFRSLIGGRR
ncbi:glycosyltransferase [Micromonosporaceae bacterium B7E4]